MSTTKRKIPRKISLGVFIFTFALLVVCWPGASNAQTIPRAPTNLVATAVSAGYIDLGWTDNADNE